MNFSVVGVSYEDAADISKNNMTAFYHTDHHWRALWNSMPLEEIIRGATARMPQKLVLGREKTRHLKAVDNSTGQVIGYARWILPEDDGRIAWPEAMVRKPTEEEADQFRTNYEENTENGIVPGMDHRLNAHLGVPLEEAEEEAMRRHQGPFLVLDYLAVHPDHRRKGIASALVKRGLEQADAVGMKVWVMATMAAQPVYEKLGFQLLRRVETSTAEFGIEEPHQKAFLMRW